LIETKFENKFIVKKTLIFCIGAMAMNAVKLHAGMDVVAGPDTSTTNSFYVSNRTPLEPSRFLPLPIGAVQPKGWLLAVLERQRDGLCGHLGEISAWLEKDGNAWLSKDGKGKYGWEEVPYWLRGYIQLAYIFNDPKMIAESEIWINGAINSQRANGDFGPDQKFDDDGSRDFWANMLMLFCLETYYEHSHDKRVLDLMTKYFKYHLTIPDNLLLTHYWQKMRGGDELYSIYWLYNRTGDVFLLELTDKIHRVTANWELSGDLPNWHNVNIAESFREPAEHYLQTHDSAELQDSYADFKEVRKRYGQVPGGMFGGDEVCRPGYADPHQAVETCGMVEQMLSDELLLQMSGDTFWADHCENVAFNTYPAALTPDMRALRYLTAPNLVVSDANNHAPGLGNGGPFLLMNPFSSRCCQHNHSMGWPYFDKHLWLATPDNGLCAAVYSASDVTAQVGDGTQVSIAEATHYPFDETIGFTIRSDKAVTFPLYLRIPGWSKEATVLINGQKQSVNPVAGKYVRLEREWNSNDTVTVELPMEISVQSWAANHDSVSVNYGPLTFSLKIGERVERLDSSKTAIGDSSWQPTADPAQWPSFGLYPTTPWNYGLVLDNAHPEKTFAIKKLPWPQDDYPFTPESAPIQIVAKGKQIPEWSLDRYGLCAVLQASPARSEQPEENITLIPMGAARLRVSAFPTIGSGAEAHQWIAPVVPHKPLYHASASHVFTGDTIDALDDGLAPSISNDESIPRFTWWDHRGTTEWVQYDFPEPKTVSAVEVYWFDDTGAGECRVPKTWRVLYQDGGDWKPVPGTEAATATRDQFNVISFPTLKTASLRIEANLQSGFSSGILEWRVKP
jgi:hypothetical protein